MSLLYSQELKISMKGGADRAASSAALAVEDEVTFYGTPFGSLI